MSTLGAKDKYVRDKASINIDIVQFRSVAHIYASDSERLNSDCFIRVTVLQAHVMTSCSVGPVGTSDAARLHWWNART